MKVNDFLVEAPKDDEDKVSRAGHMAAGFFKGIGDHSTANIINGENTPGKSFSQADITTLAKKIQNAWAVRQKTLDKPSLQNLGTYQSELDKVIGEELGGYSPTVSLRDLSVKSVREYIESAISEYDSQQATAQQGQGTGQTPQNAGSGGYVSAQGGNTQSSPVSLFAPVTNFYAAYRDWKMSNPDEKNKWSVKIMLGNIAQIKTNESKIITRGKTITNEELKRFSNKRRKIYEGFTKNEIRRVVLWEGIGRKLTESSLTAQQIDQVFQQVEQELTAGGAGTASNRTMIGKGKDVYNTVEKAVNDLGKAAQNTALVKGFDNLYDSAAEKLKQATGGDQGVMQYIQKYREFAKAHPALQNLFYTALIIGTGLATGGAGGPIVAGVFKSVDRMLQGDKLSAALAKGTTTGIKSALVAGAKGLAKDALANVTAVDPSSVPPPAHTGELDADAPQADTEDQFRDKWNAQHTAAPTDAAQPAANAQAPANNATQAATQPTAAAPASIAAPQGPAVWSPSAPQQFTFSPEQQKWLGSADIHDPYIISRMPDNLGPKPPLEFFDPKDMTPGMQQSFKPAAQMNYSAPADGPVDPNDWRQKALADFKAGRPGTPAPGYVAPQPQGVPAGAAPQSNAMGGRFYDPDGMIPGDRYRPGYGPVNNPMAPRGTFNAMEPTEPIMDPHSPYSTPRYGTNAPRYRDPRTVFQDKWSDGFQLAGVALTESQIAQIFYKIELRERAAALVQEGAWDTIKKGLIDPAEKKLKQVGKNLTTKVTADKLQKAWDKSDMPTDSEELIAFLVKQKVNRAVAEKVVDQVAGGVQPQSGATGQGSAPQGNTAQGGVPWGTPTGQSGQSGQSAQGGSPQQGQQPFDFLNAMGQEIEQKQGQIGTAAIQAAQKMLQDPWWGGGQPQQSAQAAQQPATPVQFPDPAPTAPPVQQPAQDPAPAQTPAQQADPAQAAKDAQWAKDHPEQGRIYKADKVTKKQDHYATNRKANDTAAKQAAKPATESRVMDKMLKDFIVSLNK
jgi:hypothetical protein